MSHWMKAAGTAAFLFLFGAVISAQLVKPMSPIASVPKTITGSAGASARNGQAMIHGTAVDQNASPLPNATVRLRNLATQQIEKVTTANQVGEFSFIAQPEIPYVVEIADQAGQIIAVGNVVTVQVGEVAGSVVALPTRLPALTGLAGDTAGSVVSAASNAGITASQSSSEPPPASPDK